MSLVKSVNFKKRVLSVLIVLGLVGTSIYRSSVSSCAWVCDSVVSLVAYPFLKMQEPIIAILDHIRTHRMTLHELRAHAAHLEEENRQLIAEIIDLYALQSDNQIAQEVAAVQQWYGYQDALGARIMVRLIGPDQHAILVDAGSRAGVEVDMVAVFNKCIVGRVAHVYPLYSKILLVTDPACNIAAYCARTGVHGVHEGRMKRGTTELTHVHHYDRLEIGDLLLSSGQGLIFPHGFALGRIRSFQEDGLWKRATIEPLLDSTTLDYCVLFKKGQRIQKEVNAGSSAVKE